jgi:hypothetical protein
MPTREEMIEAITQKMWTWNFWAWHLMSIEPVRIWDVLDYFQIETAIELFDMDYSWPQDNWYSKVFNKWKYKRLPIEKQSDECIKFVFDLLHKN